MLIVFFIIRHVKCDESRPACHGCVNTGRVCDGYSTKNEVAIKELVFVPPATLSRPISNIKRALSQEESQYLNQFRHVFVQELSGFAPSSLWDTLILQAMHEEPAVKYAATAFSALRSSGSHRPFTSDSNHIVFALRQYSASIKELRRLLARPTPRSINVALICSIICTSFEIIEGSHLLAQGHFDNTLRLITGEKGSFLDY